MSLTTKKVSELTTIGTLQDGDVFVGDRSGTTYTITFQTSAVDHDSLLNFVANEHIDWTSTSSNFSTSGTAATGDLSVTGNAAITGGTDEVQLTVKGNATQTSDIFKFQTSASSDLLTLSNAGLLTITGQLTVDNVSINGNTISTSSGNLTLSPTGDIDANSNQIKSVTDPTAAQDAATKNYTDTTFVAGPGSSTDNAIARYDGTGGLTVQNSGVTIDDSDVVSGPTQVNVDNLRLDGNTLSSTNTNGNIILDPDGTGSVGINGTPSAPIHLQYAGAAALRLQDTASSGTGAQSYVEFYDSAGSVGKMGNFFNTSNSIYLINDKSASIILRTASANKVTVGSSAVDITDRLDANSGISFDGGTNVLSQAESGTWTPVLYGSGTAGTPTYTTQEGRYVMYATDSHEIWFLHFHIFWTSLGGAAGEMRISGSPCTPNGHRGLFAEVYYNGLTLTEDNLKAIYDNNTSNIRFIGGTSTATSFTVDDTELSAGGEIYMQGHIIVDL